MPHDFALCITTSCRLYVAFHALPCGIFLSFGSDVKKSRAMFKNIGCAGINTIQ